MRRLKILVVNVNTSVSMTESIDVSARRYASEGTHIVALQPFFGAEGVDYQFESYLAAVGVIDRVLAYDEPYDAVVMAGFGEHGRDGIQELIEQPVVENLRGLGPCRDDDRSHLLGRHHTPAAGAANRRPAQSRRIVGPMCLG